MLSANKMNTYRQWTLSRGLTGGSLSRGVMGTSSAPYRWRHVRNSRGRPQHPSVEHITRSHAKEGLRGWDLPSSRVVTKRSVSLVYYLVMATFCARTSYDIQDETKDRAKVFMENPADDRAVLSLQSRMVALWAFETV